MITQLRLYASLAVGVLVLVLLGGMWLKLKAVQAKLTSAEAELVKVEASYKICQDVNLQNATDVAKLKADQQHAVEALRGIRQANGDEPLQKAKTSIREDKSLTPQAIIDVLEAIDASRRQRQ